MALIPPIYETLESARATKPLTAWLIHATRLRRTMTYGQAKPRSEVECEFRGHSGPSSGCHSGNFRKATVDRIWRTRKPAQRLGGDRTWVSGVAAVRCVPVISSSILAATWIGAADNSSYREEVDAFTDETEFSLTIASSALVESKGRKGAMLGLTCSPNARWIPPIELPDGRLLGDDRLDGFQVWFTFVGESGERASLRRPDWMAEVVGDGYDVLMRLRVDSGVPVAGSWKWTVGIDGRSTVFVPDSMKLRVARMVIEPSADQGAPRRLLAQIQPLTVHHFDLQGARANLDRFASRCAIVSRRGPGAVAKEAGDRGVR